MPIPELLRSVTNNPWALITFLILLTSIFLSLKNSVIFGMLNSSLLMDCTIIWGLNFNNLSNNSARNPFITDITIMRVATPMAIPRKEKTEIIFKKLSFFFDRM